MKFLDGRVAFQAQVAYGSRCVEADAHYEDDGGVMRHMVGSINIVSTEGVAILAAHAAACAASERPCEGWL